MMSLEKKNTFFGFHQGIFYAFIFPLYFSHLIALGIFLVMIFLSHPFSFRKENYHERISNFIIFLRSSIPLLLSLLPSLVLLTIFFSEKKILSSHSSSFSNSEMVEALIYILPIITLQHYPENIYSVIIFVLLISLTCGWAINRFLKRANHTISSKPFYQWSSYWLTASLLMLLFFF